MAATALPPGIAWEAPSDALIDRKPGWPADNPSDNLKNALCPWLALGYKPVPTGGATELRCAFFALSISLNAAMAELGIVPSPPVAITPNFLQSIMTSPEYLNLVQIELDRLQVVLYRDLRTLNEIRDQYTRQINLDRLAMRTIMRYLSSQYALDFDLGVITQGFWCRYDERTQLWDYNHQEPMGAQIENDDLTATNRPVIWVWNDNEEVRCQAHDDKTRKMNHWEGFAGPAFAMTAAQAETRRARVQAWDLGADVRYDVATGLWRMLADQEGPSEDGSLRQNDLAAKRGAFVREVYPPEGLEVPDGSRYMQNGGIREARTPGDDTGLVPDALLTRISLHPDAPGDPVDDEQPPATRPEKDATVTYLKNMEEAVETEGANYRPGTVNTLWRIYRVIEGTNKVGGSISAEHPVNKIIDPAFLFRNGDFMLDTGNRDEDGNVRVISIDRREGRIHPRRLQSLEEPWLLPPGMKDAALLKFNPNWSPIQLRAWAFKMQIPIPLNLRPKEKILADLVAWRDDNVVSLPLYRLKRSYTAEESGDPGNGDHIETATPAFVKGEIISPLISQDTKFEMQYLAKVRKEEGKPRENPKIRVVDFEGLMGYVSQSDLEELPDLPFGIELLRSSVPADADCDAAPRLLAPSPPDRIRAKRRAEEEAGREAKRLKPATDVETPTASARRSTLGSEFAPKRKKAPRKVVIDAVSPKAKPKKDDPKPKEKTADPKPGEVDFSVSSNADETSGPLVVHENEHQAPTSSRSLWIAKSLDEIR